MLEYDIDLSHGVRAALLSLQANPRFFEQVEALIISRPAAYNGIFMEDELYLFFSLIGRCLPRLEALTIDFDDMELPVFVLTAFLREATGLYDLGLLHVRLSGSPDEFQEMEEALQDHVGLEGVRLVHCKRHEDDPSIATRKRIPRLFCQPRNLRRLWLQDCPDNHIVSVAQAVYEGASHLKELSIVSSQLGDNGVDSISQMLQAETTLDVLRIRLFRPHALRVVESAHANSSLKKLTCDILVPQNKPSLFTDGPKRI